jgi:membrane associated rhomboid family serine protease
VVTLSFVPFFAGLYEIPSIALILAWFGLQLIGGVGHLASTDIDSGGAAYLAHFGGFAFGFATVRLFARGRAISKRPVDPPSAPGALPST